MADPRDLSLILRLLRVRTGVDASLLPGSLEDATSRRLEDTGLSLEAWLGCLSDEGARGRSEAAELLGLLGIGHTHLFRHQAVWDVLVQQLAGDGLSRTIEVLILGVSTGEEAYTAVMQLGSSLGLENISALGVDINPRSVAHAVRGSYPVRAAEHVPAWAMDRYLEPAGDGFIVLQEVRRRVRFLTGSLFEVPATGQYDLVLLRHVLIYFRVDDRRRALDRAAGLVRGGGLLVLGASEAQELSGDGRFARVREGLPVFRKVSTSTRASPLPSRPPLAGAARTTESSPGSKGPDAGPIALDGERVDSLVRPHLEGAPPAKVTIDLTEIREVPESIAGDLGRGLRLLALRGTVIRVTPPLDAAARLDLEGSLVGALVRNGMIRWEGP